MIVLRLAKAAASGLSGSNLEANPIQHCQPAGSHRRSCDWLCCSEGVFALCAAPHKQNYPQFGIMLSLSPNAGRSCGDRGRALRIIKGRV